MGLSWTRSKSKLDFTEISRKTPFTESQLKSWYKEFRKRSPDGAMTKDRFVETFHDYFSPNNMNITQWADYVFKKFDTNKDGVITFEEFIQSVAIPTHGTVAEKLDWAFSMYDADDDGYITLDEMINMVKASAQRRRFSSEQLQAAKHKAISIFSRMDLNSDGKLSRKEFINGFQNDEATLKALVGSDIKYSEAELSRRKASSPHSALSS